MPLWCGGPGLVSEEKGCCERGVVVPMFVNMSAVKSKRNVKREKIIKAIRRTGEKP